MRRAALNLAASSNRLLWATKKKRHSTGKLVHVQPRVYRGLYILDGVGKGKSQFLHRVAPASRMWYPLTLMVFHLGVLAEQYLNTSTTRRMEGWGWVNVGATGDVFLEDVVLQGAANLG